MACMRDKLRELIGKKISCSTGEYITSPLNESISYDEIIEIGDDYFVLRRVRKAVHSRSRGRETGKSSTIYAISEVKSIQGVL